MSRYTYFTIFTSIFLRHVIVTVSAVETTKVLPSLTNATTTKATTTTTTSTKPTEATTFFESNSSATTLKEMEAMITIVPHTTGHFEVKPMPATKVKTAGTYVILNITKSPTDQRTLYCFPEKLLRGNPVQVTTKCTQNGTASPQVARFFSFTPKKWLFNWPSYPATNDINATIPDQKSQDNIDTLPTPRLHFISAVLIAQTSQATPSIVVPKEQNRTDGTVKTNAPSARKPAELLGYERLWTQPFSVYLGLFLWRLAQLDDNQCARFVSEFAHEMIGLSRHKQLNHFGPTIDKFISDSSHALLKKPKNVIKGLVKERQTAMFHRRQALSAELNLLLDYMDMLFTIKDELAMESYLNNTLALPNVNKTIDGIVEDIIRAVILQPSWRLILSGKPKGRMLFEYMDKIITNHTDSDLEKRIQVLTKRNIDYIKKHPHGRVKIVCEIPSDIIKKHVTQPIKRRYIDFEGAWTRTEETTKYKYSSEIYKTASSFERHNDIPIETYWNKNRNIKVTSITERPQIYLTPVVSTKTLQNRRDYVNRFQQKKPKYLYHTKKHLQKVNPLKQMEVDDISRHALLADIDRIKQQVGKNIENEYFRKNKLRKKNRYVAKTSISPKDNGVKSNYLKDLKVHKKVINVRRNVEDLKKHPQGAKKELKFSTLNTLVDSVYSDEEKELKNNLYDALRHEDRKYLRRNLNHDLTPKRGLRDDSEYTDTEIILKQKVYKAIKNMM